MTIPSNLCKLNFLDFKGKRFHIEVNENATTDDLIYSLATAMQASQNKIMFSLDLSLRVKGNVATQENAKEVDAQVKEQFKYNIVHFIQRHESIVVVKP